MTNDIRVMRNKYIDSQIETTHNDSNNKFRENDLVINVGTGKQMRIKAITSDGKYSCYTNNGMNYEGDFSESEITIF